MSTYDPYEAVKKIFGNKQDWTKYNQSGETEKRNKAASDAQIYYNQLKQNGYTALADELSAAGLKEAEDIKNKYGKMGKTAVRKYLKTLAPQYGFTEADIDKNLNYDSDTGEITFGGMNMGKPYAVVNGVSYMPEEEITNFMKNYAEKTGTSLTADTQINSGFQGSQKKNDELWGIQKSDHNLLTGMATDNADYVKNHNPYASEIGKSIMEGFRMQGDRSAGNAMAESAASNSGNLDSFAAAEGARQRAAFEQLGKQAVLEDFNSRMGHLNDIFNNLGIYQQNQYASMGDTISRGTAIAQQVFDNDQTAKNNEVSRNVAISEITGYIPTEYDLQYNPYFKNGKLINEDIDYRKIIDAAREKLKTATDPNEIASLNATIRYANQARNQKMDDNYEKYGQYAWSKEAVLPLETASVRQENKQIKSSERIAAGNNETQLQMNVNDNNTGLAAAALEAQSNGNSTSSNSKEPVLTAAQATQAIKNGEISQGVIDAYNYYHNTNYTVDNLPPIYGQALPSETESEDWLTGSSKNSGNSTSEEGAGNYEEDLNYVYDESSKTVKKYIRDVLEPSLKDHNMTESEIKKQLIDNSEEYDLEVDDIKAICEALGIDMKWIDDYKNKGLFGWGSGVKERE